MFKINDYIMYSTTGLCQVTDITEEKLSNNIVKEYYVLNPIHSKNTVIKIPVDNKKVAMRDILSKDTVNELVNNYYTKEIEWIDDEKKRNEEFKIMLKNGSCEDLITVIRSIELNKKNKKAIGKNISKGDEEIMNKAEKLLNEEFAAVLNILPEEVCTYIDNHAKK